MNAVTFVPIVDAAYPLLADYRDLKSPTLREAEFEGRTTGRTTFFIAEGETVTRTLLSPGSLYPIRSVVLTERHRDKMADVWDELERWFSSQPNPSPALTWPSRPSSRNSRVPFPPRRAVVRGHTASHPAGGPSRRIVSRSGVGARQRHGQCGIHLPERSMHGGEGQGLRAFDARLLPPIVPLCGAG